MPKNLTVVGFGQCGSSVAVEISAKFDPIALVTAGSPIEFAFKFARDIIRPPNPDAPQISAENKPRLFIADLNTNNLVYIRTLKLSKIAESIENLDDDDNRALKYLKNKFQDLKFDNSDLDLIQSVRKNPSVAKFIVPLYFSRGGTSLIAELGGAGGQQFISEAVASTPTVKDRFLTNMNAGSDDIIFGVFAVGGGTGAGSLFSLLSEYKQQSGRYCFGIGILPGGTDGRARQNVGRYAVRYLSRNSEARYHTLALVSNLAAENAIKSIRSRGEVIPYTPITLVNQYVATFIWLFSFMRECEVAVGKSFDPMDGRINFTGMTALGMAFGSGFDPVDLVMRAISPMHVGDERLQGISIEVAKDLETTNRVSNAVKQLIKPEPATKFDKQEIISELLKLSPFYQTQKFVYICYFIYDKSLSDRTSDAQDKIERFFREVVGNNVTVNVNCLYSQELKESSVLVMSFGAFPREVLDGTMRYVSEAFSSGNEDSFDEFRDNVIGILADARTKLSNAQMKDRQRKLSECFRSANFPDEELLSEEAKDVTSNMKSFLDVVGDTGISQYLIKRHELKDFFDRMLTAVSVKPDFRSGVDDI